jgi:hypothetical protein
VAAYRFAMIPECFRRLQVGLRKRRLNIGIPDCKWADVNASAKSGFARTGLDIFRVDIASRERN